MSVAASPQASATISRLYRQFLRLAAQYPPDPLRPTQSFHAALRCGIQERFRAPLSTASSSALGADNTASEDGIIEAARSKALRDAEVQLTALSRIINNAYKSEFPLSEKIMTPAENPKYYGKLIEQMERAREHAAAEASDDGGSGEGPTSSIIRRFFRHQ